jgi:AraC-like DNA-binding protein
MESSPSCTRRPLTLELLCAAVSSFRSLLTTFPNDYTERTLRCLQAARSLPTLQFSPAPKIHKIARQLGITETALTRGFKAIYGETKFEFRLCCRM